VPRIIIREEICKRCGMCAHICPEGLFVQKQPRTVPRITRKSACIDCGHCVSVCEAGAIEHSSFPPEDFIRNQ
jgi:ferredoxin